MAPLAVKVAVDHYLAPVPLPRVLDSFVPDALLALDDRFGYLLLAALLVVLAAALGQALSFVRQLLIVYTREARDAARRAEARAAVDEAYDALVDVHPVLKTMASRNRDLALSRVGPEGSAAKIELASEELRAAQQTVSAAARHRAAD